MLISAPKACTSGKNTAVLPCVKKQPPSIYAANVAASGQTERRFQAEETDEGQIAAHLNTHRGGYILVILGGEERAKLVACVHFSLAEHSCGQGRGQRK